MNTTTEKFRCSLPQNLVKATDSHPDFSGELNIAGTKYKAATWFSATKQNVPYLAMHLEQEGASRGDKIKVAIWKRHDRKSTDEPHFESVQPIGDEQFKLQAWILPAGNDHRVELIVESLGSDQGETSEALATTRKRLVEFLAATGSATLPAAAPKSTQEQTSPAARETLGHAQGKAGDRARFQDLDEPDDIPF